MNTDQNVAPVTTVTPLTGTQLALVEIWKRMLWLDDIGVHESFIDLGGNSLSATRCLNRIRETFEVDVPMDAFFLDPADIATIAQLIDDARAEMFGNGRPVNDCQSR